jgi:hypothetical protein
VDVRPYVHHSVGEPTLDTLPPRLPSPFTAGLGPGLWRARSFAGTPLVAAMRALVAVDRAITAAIAQAAVVCAFRESSA